MTVENISRSISTKECCRPRRGLNLRPPGLQSDGASNWATEAADPVGDLEFNCTVETIKVHYQPTLFLCRLFLYVVNQYLCAFFCQKLTIALLEPSDGFWSIQTFLLLLLKPSPLSGLIQQKTNIFSYFSWALTFQVKTFSLWKLRKIFQYVICWNSFPSMLSI